MQGSRLALTSASGVLAYVAIHVLLSCVLVSFSNGCEAFECHPVKVAASAGAPCSTCSAPLDAFSEHNSSTSKLCSEITDELMFQDSTGASWKGGSGSACVLNTACGNLPALLRSS